MESKALHTIQVLAKIGKYLIGRRLFLQKVKKFFLDIFFALSYILELIKGSNLRDFHVYDVVSTM